MELTLSQQIVALIERSQNILLCTHRKPDGDAAGSIMALYKALKLMGKKVTAACADGFPENFQFLPELDEVTQTITGARDFVVSLDCDQAEVDRLKYHLEDNKIHIVITPKSGKLEEKNVSFKQEQGQFDLIITVDVADIPQLGHLYDDNSDLFTSLPVINIDHHVSNTQFGKLNLIDVAASSTAEILYGLIQELEQKSGQKLIVPETATFLLSGITTDTGSFQNANTTPKAMAIAADLIDKGADQQDIIKYLFRTKKLSTLKLWGRILNKIEVDEKHRLVWSSVTQQDLKGSGAVMDEVGNIIDELMVHAPEAEIVALFKEDPDQISLSLRSKNADANVMEIAQQFGGGGHVQASGVKFKGKSMAEVQNMVLAFIQQKQQARLGLTTEMGQAAAADSHQQTEITQVLDGYTQNSTIQPTLEQKAQPVEIKPGQEVTPVAPPQAPKAPVQAAIQAEQSQGDMNSAAPSEGAKLAERPKPAAEKRFNQPLPDFLKPQAMQDGAQPQTGTSGGQQQQGGQQQDGQQPAAQQPPVQQPPVQQAPPAPAAPPAPPVQPAPQVAPTPAPAPAPAPQPAAPADEGVKVSYGNAGTPPPAAPADTSDVVVKNMGGGQTGQGDQGQAGAPQPPAKPEPPKDPFAIGDDGLTDIERALGNL